MQYSYEIFVTLPYSEVHRPFVIPVEVFFEPCWVRGLTHSPMSDYTHVIRSGLTTHSVFPNF